MYKQYTQHVYMYNIANVQVHTVFYTCIHYTCTCTFDTKIPLSFGSRGLPMVDLVPPFILTPNLADADFSTTTTYIINMFEQIHVPVYVCT